MNSFKTDNLYQRIISIYKTVKTVTKDATVGIACGFISGSSIYSFEKGKSLPSVAKALKLAAYLGINTDALIHAIITDTLNGATHDIR